MATQLIMTVGTNALPVWVAWHHLKDKLEPSINKVRFIHTNDTEPQKDLLEEHCNPASFGKHIKTSPGNPGKVRQDIRQKILNGLDENTTHLHVHYTGGTQVMGVETVSAIEERVKENANLTLDTSYLNARSGKEPCLTSRHRNIKPDTRDGIAVALNRIALLNSFTLAPFDDIRTDSNGDKYNNEYYRRGNWIKEYLDVPAILTEDQETKGKRVLDGMRGRDSWRRGAIRGLNGTNFEYAAYVALKQTLKDITQTNASRSNYQVYHKVYVKRTNADVRDPAFELDVVAILGYQIVVISCTLDDGTLDDEPNIRKIIKQKGMEAIIRARQLGGDEAQAIVLCKAHPNDAQLLQEELHDEVGSAGKPLRIWGTDMWHNLQQKFYNYLRNDLHWQ